MLPFLAAAQSVLPLCIQRGSVAARLRLTDYLLLSLAAALLTIAFKTAAYLQTGAVGLLADAVESIVNLVAAAAALFWLRIAHRPPDREHAYGHSKAEYFAAGIEGALVLVAAAGIAATAVERLWQPAELQLPPLGIAASLAATAINGVVAVVLLRAGRRHRSLTLEADGRHLLADVWTSAAVLGGLAVAAVSGLTWLDPLLAIAVAAHVAATGVHLLSRAAHGLLDRALEAPDLAQIHAALAVLPIAQCEFHALRTRQAGSRRFVSFHLLVPDEWTIQRAHAYAEQIEDDIRRRLPQTTVFTHLEPRNDPLSFLDTGLDRHGIRE
jgi:cation diffusion facilitator family transporter